MATHWAKVYGILLALQLLIYVDRGIVGEASPQLEDFAGQTFPPASTGALVGLLQSAIIIGLSLTSPAFGHLVQTRPPFVLLGIGIAILTIAVALSAAASPVGSYSLLLLARMMTGVGEGAFVSISGPIVLDMGGARKGFWLSLLYCLIPVGIAVGNVFGSVTATSSWGWAAAFVVETFLLLPFPAVCWWMARDPHFRSVGAALSGGGDPTTAAPPPHFKRLGSAETIETEEDEGGDEDLRGTVTFGERLRIVLSSVHFLLFCGSNAAIAAVAMSMSLFGTKFAMSLGVADSQRSAALLIGTSCGVAGILGTAIGGVVLDKFSRDESKDLVTRVASFCMFSSAIGFAACSAALVVAKGVHFALMLSLSFTALFACQMQLNTVSMLIFAPEHRAFAGALTSVALHLFGDVPGPIVVGWLKNRLVSPTSLDGGMYGTRLTIAVCCLWLLWVPVCSFVAICINQPKESRARALALGP